MVSHIKVAKNIHLEGVRASCPKNYLWHVSVFLLQVFISWWRLFFLRKVSSFLAVELSSWVHWDTPYLVPERYSLLRYPQSCRITNSLSVCLSMAKHTTLRAKLTPTVSEMQRHQRNA